jgi:electron transfer flavoprotein alpha subunit
MDAKHQIGLSGRTVKPKFILCLGISGAVQFAAGMKASDCIVAVNTDKNAPIFDVAHYGIVGDVNEILPKLIAKVKEAKDNV